MNEQELTAKQLLELAESVMTPTQWQTFRDHYRDGVTVLQIATAERVSEQAVRDRLKGAWRRLNNAREKAA